MRIVIDLPENTMNFINDDSIYYEIRGLKSCRWLIKDILDAVRNAEPLNNFITRSDLEDALDALHEHIRDTCQEAYINDNHMMIVDADKAADMVYEVLEVFEE